MCDKCNEDLKQFIQKVRERHGDETKEFYDALSDCYEDLTEKLGDGDCLSSLEDD
jgi:uncharacterized protein (UPF0335 family)